MPAHVAPCRRVVSFRSWRSAAGRLRFLPGDSYVCVCVSVCMRGCEVVDGKKDYGAHEIVRIVVGVLCVIFFYAIGCVVDV